MQARSVARNAGLFVIVFVATIVLLVGGWALLARSSDGSAGRSPAVIGAASPSVGPSIGSVQPSPSRSLAPGESAAPESVVLVGAGDIADCDTDGARLTSELLLRETGVVFTLGDNAYEDGTSDEFARCYEPTWGRVRDRTLLPAAGNHDWNTENAAGYRAYFGAAAAGPDGATWYSRDLGAWHVIVLDSDCAKVGGCGPESPQGQWLATDLAGNDARCTLALYHHPRFSSGQHGNDEVVQPLWAQLHAAGVDLVLNGHDHDYERFAPMDASGTEQRPGGMREIVVGTGGTGLREFRSVVANSEFRLTGTWGILRLRLHQANYDWEFVPVTGAITDAGSAVCH